LRDNKKVLTELKLNFAKRKSTPRSVLFESLALHYISNVDKDNRHFDYKWLSRYFAIWGIGIEGQAIILKTSIVSVMNSLERNNE